MAALIDRAVEPRPQAGTSRPPLRILLVTPEPPSPRARGGRPQATAATLGALVDRHDVTLVTQAGGDPDDGPALDRWRGAGVDVHVAWWPRPTGLALLGRRVDLARRWAFGKDPWSTVRYADPAVQRLLDDLLRDRSFDAILVEDNVMAGYAYRSSTPKILTEHEVRRRRTPRRLDALHRRGLAGWLAEADWQRWLETHRRAWAAFDRVQLLTPADEAVARSFAPELAHRFRLNPIGIEVPPVVPTRERRAGSLVFVGALSHAPNVDAAEWLARDVLPAVRRHHPEATLTIVGQSPPAAVRSLAGPEIEVTGPVPDVEPFLAPADVVLAPVRIGGGLRTKVLQAMALAKAVVTTTRGAEGIDVDPRAPQLVVADTAAAIASETVALLDDARRRRELGDRARAYVLARHSPSAYGERLEAILDELVGGSADAAATAAN